MDKVLVAIATGFVGVVGLRALHNVSGGSLGRGRGASPLSVPRWFYTTVRDDRLARQVERPKTLPRPGTITVKSAGFRI